MKILVVEDERRVAYYIKKGLEQKAQTVDVAYDGLTGLDMASTENYDVVILDWMLPEMNGLEVCKNLRSEGDSTPILMLTAKGEVDDKVQGLEYGADDYLVKPFAFAELMARIKALGRRPRQALDNELVYDDLSMNTSDFEVRRDDEYIQLTKKEFALLEYMMRNRGKVVSKDQITQQVWDFDADVLPNTAQVYIGYLRNKLDKPYPNKPQLIQTVRGFGYRLGEAND